MLFIEMLLNLIVYFLYFVFQCLVLTSVADSHNIIVTLFSRMLTASKSEDHSGLQ